MGDHCYSYIFIFMILPYGVTSEDGEKYDRPAKCSLLGKHADCSHKSFYTVPQIPIWVEHLDLNFNKLPNNKSLSFQDFPNLTTLELNNNDFVSFPLLTGAASLKSLSLSHNKFKAVHNNSLQNLLSVEDLNLNFNFIEEISAGNFPVNNNLQVIRLSNNKIKSLNRGALDSLSKLIELKLNKNRIHSIPPNNHMFTALKNLKALDINKNALKQIHSLIFQGLEQLKTLRLRHNSINVIMDGAFFGLKSINSLQLDYNDIATVSKGWMYGLECLVTMSLSYNVITDIESDSWEPANKLENLDLSHNKISLIDGHTFEHLQFLRVLKLNYNKISSITQDAFTHTSSLEELYLSHNEISWMVEDNMNGPFSKLHNLLKINLASNHIKSINPRAFEGLKSLTHLDLNNNNITSIQEHAFDSLVSLKELSLNSSTLLCDCNLQWISLWIQSIFHSKSISALCAYPSWLRGQPIASLKSKNFTCDDSPKPRLIQQPSKHQLAIKGRYTYLICTAISTSSATMTFLWKKNYVNISNPLVKENITTTDDGQVVATSELTIPNVTHADSGKYQCVVSNNLGTTYSDPSRLSIVIFPRFIKFPQNVTVKVGETAKLNCAAGGEPTPEISWKKDGGNDFPAARERRMYVLPSDHEFFIINAKISDIGIYSCTAKNSAGMIISNATLNVLEAPAFVNMMENKEVTAGENVVLQCMTSGSPKPQLRWLKDGNPIVPSDRYFFTAEDQLMIIVRTISSDAGRYDCEITNVLGTVTDSTKLLVKQNDMTGIIIITVACCAVGTSIIWVVIIYQARKRSNSAVRNFNEDSLNMVPVPAEREPSAPLYSDSVSERSSSKDSGTGDSAKQSSFEAMPLDEVGQAVEQPGYNPYGAAGGYGAPPQQLETGHGPYPSVGPQGGVSPQVQQWFYTVDKDRSGFITANELKSALVNAQGQNFSDTACKLMIGMFDHDRSGHINVEEFDKLYTYVNQWLAVFKTYDADQSGHIDQGELSQAFSQMGFRFTPEFINFLVKKSDPMENSKVTVDQFIVLSVQIQRFTEAFKVRDEQRSGTISIGFEDFLSVALSCTI